LGGEPEQGLELFLVPDELGGVRQLLVDEEVGDFLELGSIGEIEDVVAAVVQVVAGAADRAQRGVPGWNAGQRDRFLGLRGRRGLAHRVFSLANNWSSLRS
jgi:hypothetical protein